MQLAKRFGCFAAATFLCSVPAFADVTVTLTEAAKTDPWAKTFGGGDCSVESLTGFGTTGSTSTAVAAGSGVVQSFHGDGKKLKGVGFYFSSTSAPADGREFTISVIDYGTEGPVKTTAKLNMVQTPIFSDTFSWKTSGQPKQYYFEFSGASSIVLESTHFYGISLQFDRSGGNQFVVRSNNDAYADGRMAIGTPGMLTTTFAAGERDASFAVYTAAIAPKSHAF